MMHCHCCRDEIKFARKVKLRPVCHYEPPPGGPPYPASVVTLPAYLSYRENSTYRWAFICHACYRLLDNEGGRAEIPGRGEFNIAGASRGDKAAIVDEVKYLKFQRKEAEKMGLAE
jgi:hypothetical protein